MTTWFHWNSARQAAFVVRVGRSSTSAEMPSSSCKRRIMLIDNPRRRFNPSATLVRLPRSPSQSLQVSSCCSMRNLIASIGSGGPVYDRRH